MKWAECFFLLGIHCSAALMKSLPLGGDCTGLSLTAFPSPPHLHPLPASYQNCPGSSSQANIVSKRISYIALACHGLILPERSAQELFLQARDNGENRAVSLHRPLCGDWPKQIHVSSRKKKKTKGTSPLYYCGLDASQKGGECPF